MKQKETRSAFTKLALASALLAATWLAIAPATLADPLADSHWSLVEFQSMDDAIGTVEAGDGELVTMHLADDGTASLVLACNRAKGPWKSEASAAGSGGKFELGPLTSTEALCPEAQLANRLATDATYIRSYLLKDGRLFLSLFADGGIYTWRPHDAEAVDADGSAADAHSAEDPATETAEVPNGASPERGGYRNWQVSEGLNLRQSRSTQSAIVARLEAGEILDNMGCEPAEGRLWCYVQPLGGGPVGFVAHEFLLPAVAPNGVAMTGPDDSALRLGQGSFDASGRIPCRQRSDQPMTRCDFQVARAGGGYAAVRVTLPDGRARLIYFRMGQAIGAGTAEADDPGPYSSTRQGDLTTVVLGEEKYEIPDAVPLGG